MTLRVLTGRPHAEETADVVDWLRGLSGCPSVDETAAVMCPAPSHGEDPGTWFYVEADAAEGLARFRCLGCGSTRSLLDSEARWTYPPAWSCRNCRQAIAEPVVGLHIEASGLVSWAALAVRCVECGSIDGVADAVVPSLPVEDIVTT